MIENSALDPAECDLERLENRVYIRHTSGSLFQIQHRRNDFSAAATIADNGLIAHTINFGTKDNLGDLRGCVYEWTILVKELIDMPDLWEERADSRRLVAEMQSEDIGNTPFTQDEQRQISTQLQVIKEQIREQFTLTNEQIGRVDGKIDDVIEASTRLGRKDWLIYAIGSITTLIITATVAAGVGEHIIAIIIQGFIHLVTGGSAPPQILG